MKYHERENTNISRRGRRKSDDRISGMQCSDLEVPPGGDVWDVIAALRVQAEKDDYPYGSPVLNIETNDLPHPDHPLPDEVVLALRRIGFRHDLIEDTGA